MKNLAPNIFRQRLLLEAFYTTRMNEELLEKYLLNLAKHLNLRTYGKPVIFTPASSIGKKENAGYDAFVPLIDSGISAYVWTRARFLSILIYTCKGFDEPEAIAFTRQYFEISEEIVSASF